MKVPFRLAILVGITALLISATAALAGDEIRSAAGLSKATKKAIKKESVKQAKKYAKTYAKPGPAGPAGPAGAQGPQGGPGPQGPGGPAGIARIFEVESRHITLAPGESTFNYDFDADCPAGSRVTGTGTFNSVATEGFTLAYGTFVGGYIYNDTGISVTVWIQAICAQGPGMSAKQMGKTSLSTSKRGARDQYRADLKAFHSKRKALR